MAAVPTIEITPENCRGCRRCEVSCAWHDPGPLNPRRAGIRIVKSAEGGSDRPVMNRQCRERFCGKARRQDNPGPVPACVGACLFGALAMNWKDGDNG